MSLNKETAAAASVLISFEYTLYIYIYIYIHMYTYIQDATKNCWVSYHKNLLKIIFPNTFPPSLLP